MTQEPITPRYAPGAIVTHMSDESARGIVVAFMVRAENHSFQVQWGIEKCDWHLDFELKPLPDAPHPIGFWRKDP